MPINHTTKPKRSNKTLVKSYISFAPRKQNHMKHETLVQDQLIQSNSHPTVHKMAKN